MAGLTFDDLIPAAQPKPQQAGGLTFDDLIPQPAGPAFEQIAQVPGGRRMGRGGLVPTADEMRMRRETGEAVARGAAQGLTLGAGDELYGAAVGAGNWVAGNGYQEHYARERDAVRAGNKASEEAHPAAYLSGQVAGGLATTAAGGALPGGARMLGLTGGNLLKRGVASAASGGAIAGAQGFLEGEGGVDQRFDDAAEGAKWGVGVGAVAPVIARGVGAAVSGAHNLLTPTPAPLNEYSAASVKRLARALRDDVRGGFDVEGSLARLPNEGMLLDAPGPNMRSQAERLFASPGEGGATIQKAINERAAGAPDRIRTAADEALGPNAGREAERAALEEARRTNISPLYDMAREYPQPLEIQKAGALIDDAMLTATGKKRAALESIKSQMFNDGVPKSSAAALHELRSEIGRGMRDEWRDISGALKPIQRAIDEQLDTVPGYASARSQYAESKQIEEAMDAGADTWRRGTRRDEMTAALSKMTEPERAAFLLASRDALAENMDNAGRSLGQIGADQETIRGATSTLGNTANRDKALMIARTPEAGEALLNRVDFEAGAASRANEIMGNSRTEARRAAEKEFPGHTDVAFNRNLAPATAPGMLLATGDWLLRKASMGALDARRARVGVDAAKMYTSAGPSRQDLARALMNMHLQREAGSQAAIPTEKLAQMLMMSEAERASDTPVPQFTQRLIDQLRR